MNMMKTLKSVLNIGVCSTMLLTGIMAFEAPVKSVHADAYTSEVQTNTATAHISSEKRFNVVTHGEKFMGRPYDFGATPGQTKTFDCSSFTKYLYAAEGINLPRQAIQQAEVGDLISRSDLMIGDLIFFSTSDRNGRGRVNHVAIYAGKGRILHTFGAPGVTYSKLSDEPWNSSYVTARRVFK